MAWTGVAMNRGTWKKVTRERRKGDREKVKKSKEMRYRMKRNIE